MKRVRFGDILVLVLSLCIIIYAGFHAYQGGKGALELHIEVDGVHWVYPLDHDRVITVSGPIGPTVIVIEGGYAHVKESPCKAKICIATGEISKPGEWIICLPNKVFITVEGASEQTPEVDDVVY